MIHSLFAGNLAQGSTLVFATILYLIANKWLDSLLKPAVAIWSSILKITCTGYLFFAVAVNALPLRDLAIFAPVQIQGLESVEWAIIFSGLLLTRFSEGMLIYVAILISLIFKLHRPGTELDIPAFLLIVSAAINSFNLRLHRKESQSFAPFLSRLFLSGLCILSVSCSLVALQNTDAFFLWSKNLITIDQNSLSVVVVMGAVSWVLVLLKVLGRSAFPLLFIPTSLCVRFIFPDLYTLTPALMGAVVGLMCNPTLFEHANAEKIGKKHLRTIRYSV